MALSRKSYEAIAKVIHDATFKEFDADILDRDMVIDGLIKVFVEDNDRFSETLFREACNGK